MCACGNLLRGSETAYNLILTALVPKARAHVPCTYLFYLFGTYEYAYVFDRRVTTAHIFTFKLYNFQHFFQRDFYFRLIIILFYYTFGIGTRCRTIYLFLLILSNGYPMPV